MLATSDTELLNDFARTQSEAAFYALVARHVGHVHSVASRVTRSPELAADVAQRVFTRLAQRPSSLPPGVSLSAWLHTTTRSFAIDLVRTEEARRRREKEFHHFTVMNAPDPPDWSELEPVIDEAVDSLSPGDREPILLRFYQNHSHAEIGRQLNVAEDAARMRVRRSLEKLRRLLARKGITTTASALAATLPVHAVPAAPLALTASITTAALGSAGTAAAAQSLQTTVATMTKSHLAAVAAIAVAVPIIALQYLQNAHLKNETDALRIASKLATAAAPPLASAKRFTKSGRGCREQTSGTLINNQRIALVVLA